MRFVTPRPTVQPVGASGRGIAAALLLAAAVTWAGCASTGSQMPPGVQPDRYLFEQGNAALNERQWLRAREYFRQLIDSYPQSEFRADAKLGMGDAYLGEGTSGSYVLAQNEFREFLTFYPTHPRADYAQYKLAMADFNQMRAAQRDQTHTRAAIDAFETFVERYPNSNLMPEVREKLREAKDRLSRASYLVGLFYFRQEWYPGAIARFQEVLEDDPEYTGRDAVYYHLAESLMRINREAEALPYFERLIKEFEQSEYLERAWKRVGELKTQNAQTS